MFVLFIIFPSLNIFFLVRFEFSSSYESSMRELCGCKGNLNANVVYGSSRTKCCFFSKIEWAVHSIPVLRDVKIEIGVWYVCLSMCLSVCLCMCMCGSERGSECLMKIHINIISAIRAVAVEENVGRLENRAMRYIQIFCLLVPACNENRTDYMHLFCNK